MIVKYAITSSLLLQQQHQRHHHSCVVVNRRLAPPTASRGGVVVTPTTTQARWTTTSTPTSTTTALPSTFFWDGDGIDSATTEAIGNSIQSSISTIQNTIGSFISQTQETMNAIFQQQQQLLPPVSSSSSLQHQPPLLPLPLSPPENINILQVQQFGEKIFAATFLVAFVQAMLIWIEYVSSPTGVLVIPPGLTHGIEYPKIQSSSNKKDAAVSIGRGSQQLKSKSSKNNNNNNKSLLLSLQNNRNPKSKNWDTAKQKDQIDSKSTEINERLNTTTTTTSSSSNKWLSMIKVLRNSAGLFIPWASDACGILFEGKMMIQILHIGMLYSLASLYDIPRRWFLQKQQQVQLLDQTITDTILFNTTTTNSNNNIIVTSTSSTNVPRTSKNDIRYKHNQPNNNHRPEATSGATKGKSKPGAIVPDRVVVLGDSLAIGIGSVNQFESYRPLYFRAENIADNDDNKNRNVLPGPVFPRVFASALATQRQKPVYWRSAGVDGGDTNDISEYCLGVIEEEVEKGTPPDVLLLILGVNDLKYFCGNPLKHGGPHEFRSSLTQLILDVRKISPKTKVVLPGLRLFHQKSPFNVIPLTFFLDRVLGFWDDQKKLVASRFPDSEVMYVGVSPEEVKQWYRTDTSEYGIETEIGPDGQPNMSLIAADGLHPNARCYAHWGATLARKVSDSILLKPSIKASTTTNNFGARSNGSRTKKAFALP